MHLLFCINIPVHLPAIFGTPHHLIIGDIQDENIGSSEV